MEIITKKDSEKEEFTLISGVNRLKAALTIILLCLAVGFLQKEAAAAENDKSADIGGYSAEDITVINTIIEKNGLSDFNIDDPSGWEASGIVVWSQDSPKRIVKLELLDHLLSGSLSIEGLTELTDLTCGDPNKSSTAGGLTDITVMGLTKLTNLNLSSNRKLTKLTLDGLTQLTTLLCGNGSLTNLNMTGLDNLTTLKCTYNQLSALDVSGLPNLTELDCTQNKLIAIKGLKETTKLSLKQWKLSNAVDSDEAAYRKYDRAEFCMFQAPDKDASIQIIWKKI